MDKSVQQHVFRFADCFLRQESAHDGIGLIYTTRVRDATFDGGAPNFVDLTVVPPGCSIGSHTHGFSDEEIYVVIRGRGAMNLDGIYVEVGPGDVVINRPGGSHGLANTGTEAIFLVVIDVSC